MKTYLRSQGLIFFLLVGLAGPLMAAGPGLPATLNYQGRLRLSAGAPVPDGSGNTLVFRLYTQLSGGVDIWNETWNSGTSNVATKDGLFNVILGTYNPLILPFDQQYWLGVQVNGDAEMTPRQPLTLAPYAFRAHSLELPLSQALDLGGQPAIDVNNTSSSAAGMGVRGLGYTGVLGTSTASGGTGVLADQGSGALALRALGSSLFSGGSVTFSSHVDFSGATITGWNLTTNVGAPLNLGANAAQFVLSVSNTGNGEAIRAWGYGTGPAISASAATYDAILGYAQGNGAYAGVRGIAGDLAQFGVAGDASGSNKLSGIFGTVGAAAFPVIPGNGTSGVVGATNVANGTGVVGMATCAGCVGVWASGDLAGISATAAAVGGSAVFGTAAGSLARAVVGYSTGNGPAAAGVYAKNTGAGARALVADGNGMGISATASSATGIALFASAPIAISSSGNVQFNGVGKSVSFSTHVDFSGATITGWNMPVNVAAPLNLTNTGVESTLFANNFNVNGVGVYIRATGTAAKALVIEGQALAISATAASATSRILVGSGSTSNELVRMTQNGSGPGVWSIVNNSNPAFYGQNLGSGPAVSGTSSAGSGVYGSGNIGVNGVGTNYGVYGDGGSSYGVWGQSSGGGATLAGVYGNNTAGGPGVYGSSTSGNGVYGSIGLGTANGVRGESSGTGAAVFGQQFSTGPGVTGQSNNGIGVKGQGNPGVDGTTFAFGGSGVRGNDSSASVTSTGVLGISTVGAGVKGTGLTGVAGVATAAGGYGVYAVQNTGALALRVQGDALFSPGSVTFASRVDFSGATVTGLTVPLVLPLSATAGAPYPSAVIQVTNSGTGHGLRGTATQPGVFATGFLDSTLSAGVYGSSAASISAGVIGISLDTTQSNAGVIGISVNGSGVIGQSYGVGNTGGKFQSDSGTAIVAQGLNGLNATANFTSGTAVRASTNGASDRVALDVSGPAKFNSVGGSVTSQVDFFTDVAFHGNVTGLPGGGSGVPLILSGALASPVLQVTNTNTGGGDGASIVSQNGYGLNVTGNWVGLNVSATSGASNAIYAQNSSNLGTVLANQSGNGAAFRGQASNLGLDLSVGNGGGGATGVQAFVSSTASFSPSTGGLFHVDSHGFNADARGQDISATTYGGGNALGIYSVATAVSAAATALRGESHSGSFSYGAGVYGSADTVNAYGVDAYNTAGVGLRAYGPTYAIEADNDINANSHLIRNLQYPTFSGDAANKQYVDDHALSNPLALSGTSGGAIISGTNDNVAGGYGLYGAASGLSNSATGVYAANSSPFGYALQAVNASAGNGATGIYANGNTAITALGTSIGLSVTATNGAGFGIFALNTGAAGNGNAILAYDSSSTGVAIAGANSASSGNSVGVLGQTNSNAGFGVAGFTPGGNTYAAIGAGSYGYSGNSSQAGVLGNAPSFVGVYGQGQQGVVAVGSLIALSATATSGLSGTAVYARSKNTNTNTGTIFSQNDASGGQVSAIFALSSSGIGVVGSNSSAPTLPPTSAGVAGYNTNGYGVWGRSNGSSGGQPGVWGENTTGGAPVGVAGSVIAGPAFPAAAVGVIGFAGVGGVGVYGKATGYGAATQGIYGTVNGNSSTVDGSAGVAAANSVVSAVNGSPAVALDVDGAISMNTTRTDRSAGTISVALFGGTGAIGFANGPATINSTAIRATNCLILLTVVDPFYPGTVAVSARIQSQSSGSATIMVNAVANNATNPGSGTVTVNYLIINTR